MNELNDLSTNNTPITYVGKTNNTWTSDELSANPMYQNKMGTAYSISKKVSTGVKIVGITFVLTATAIVSGSFLTNVFILNPPTVSEVINSVTGDVFNYRFIIENKGKYTVTMFINKNGEEVLKEDCSTPNTYEGTYSPLEENYNYKFYIQFSNNFDYTKVIYTHSFVKGA